MASSEQDPKTQFEGLVPGEAKADPRRLTYNILSEYSEAEIDELCISWKLDKNQAKLLKKIWRTHPDRRWMRDWLFGWLGGWNTSWLTRWLSGWLRGWFSNWLLCGLISWLSSWLSPQSQGK